MPLDDMLETYLKYRPCPACQGAGSTGCLLCHGTGKLMGPTRNLSTQEDNARLRADFESITFRCTCGAEDPVQASMDPNNEEEVTTCESCGKLWRVYRTPRVDIRVYEASEGWPPRDRPYAGGTY